MVCGNQSHKEVKNICHMSGSDCLLCIHMDYYTVLGRKWWCTKKKSYNKSKLFVDITACMDKCKLELLNLIYPVNSFRGN